MRTKIPPRGVSLQKRDVFLIRLLAEEFRILSREQIAELLAIRSVSRLNFRLKKLRDVGYLSSRPISGTGARAKRGYYLGPRSCELFADPNQERLLTSIRMQAAQLAESGLPHRMFVDSVHIRFLSARRDYPNFKLLTWIDQYSPSWESMRLDGIPVQADAYGEYAMLLHFENLVSFFLEVDRGTERGQMIQDKIERYIRYDGLQTQPFRVLFVTETTRRMGPLLKLMEAQTDNIFWITSWDQFKKAKLFDRYWLRPHNQGYHSLSSPA